MPAVEVRRIDPAATRPLRREVLRPYLSVGELAAHEAPGSFAVGGFVDGELVAVGLVTPDGEPGGWRIRGMATAPAARRRGAGTAVLARLLDHARTAGATRIWANVRTPARTLYERGGLSVVSEAFDLPRIGPHLVMEWRARLDAGEAAR